MRLGIESPYTAMALPAGLSVGDGGAGIATAESVRG